MTLFFFPLFGTIKSEAYPAPLNKEDEAKYLLALQSGDKEARNKLILHNLRLVAHIAKKYENTCDDKDDILSIGIIGLIKGVDSFNFKATNTLSTYVAKCIENEILMHLRSAKNKHNYISLSNPIGLDKDGNEIELMDIVKDPSTHILDVLVSEENYHRLYKALKLLNEKELDIIKKRYGLFNTKIETQKELAKKMKISRSYVSRIEKRALMKLYLALQEIV